MLNMKNRQPLPYRILLNASKATPMANRQHKKMAALETLLMNSQEASFMFKNQYIERLFRLCLRALKKVLLTKRK